MPETIHEPNKKGLYRAGFVMPQLQKSSLTMITPNELTRTLFNFYPILIILECVLNYTLWINDDLCLPFIHLVLFCLIINIFPGWNGNVPAASQCSWYEKLILEISFLFSTWIGFISFCILLFSMFYYIITVHESIKNSEQPTLDDIVVVLESVLNKLEIIKEESLGRRLRVSNSKIALKLIILLTPLQLILFKDISPKLYVFSSLIIIATYHSMWFQAMLKLFWRIILVRRCYYFIQKIISSEVLELEDTIMIDDIIKCQSLIFSVPFSKTLNMLDDEKAKMFLLKLYPKEVSLNKTNVVSYSKDSIKIVELEIYENQRRWSINKWENYLLPYERSNYTIEIDGKQKNIMNPMLLKITSVKNLKWLDDTWVIGAWRYSDSNWNIIGTDESLETYTRSRIWKRRLYYT